MRKFSNVYAIVCTVLLGAGLLAVFFFAQDAGLKQGAFCLVGIIASFILVPVYHELGHVAFAQMQKMTCVYVKCFCLRFENVDGKKKLSFASPFSADRTQVLPKQGGNMEKRAAFYTVGGLVFSGVLLLTVLTGAIICSAFGVTNYWLWGFVPYAAYSFLLNVAPVEYAGGKTDALVYKGIKKGYDEEKVMLSAMEIQGRVYAGERFSQVEEEYYFDIPQLCEDEPLFAVMLDLRYRYYLDKGDMENAAKSLNRLAQVQAYLSQEEVENVAVELVYMHSVTGDAEAAQANAELCHERLQKEILSSKRALAAYLALCGKTEAVKILKEQAAALLQTEKNVGLVKFEETLLSRIEEE